MSPTGLVPESLIRSARLFPIQPILTNKFTAMASQLRDNFAQTRTLEIHKYFEFCLGTPIAQGSSQLNSSLPLDKGKPVARLGRKATGQG